MTTTTQRRWHWNETWREYQDEDKNGLSHSYLNALEACAEALAGVMGMERSESTVRRYLEELSSARIALAALKEARGE